MLTKLRLLRPNLKTIFNLFLKNTNFKVDGGLSLDPGGGVSDTYFAWRAHCRKVPVGWIIRPNKLM